MNPNPPVDWTERSHTLAAALSRVALGDRAAFAQLYKLSSAQMFGVILRINSDRAQAEDVLQDCFVNIWRAAQSFDATRAQPMTWLTSIARNRAIDSLRRRKSEVVTLSSHVADVEDGEERDLLAAVPSADAGPLELLQQAADAHELTHCISRLSAEQQQCVALAYYQGLSHAEVAQHLVQPLGTVKSWVRRALMALKDCLGRAGTQPGGV
jgi:RNA polymerase sigma-70 factor (ECF subfamily)